MANYLGELHNVSPEIIKRGKEYYQEGKISNFHGENGIFHAKVQGNNEYDTTIEIKDGKLKSYSCSCPCRGICKHVVALLLKVEEEKNKELVNPFETLRKKISSASFSENLEEFKGLPHKINGFLPYLRKDEYMSLIVSYLSSMAKNENLLADGNIAERFKTFKEKAQFSSDDIKKIISLSVDSLKNSSDGAYNFISSFIKDESTSKETQNYLIDEYDNDNKTAKYCITCLSGKDLPRYLTPSFTCLLAKTSPRLLTTENILIAKEEVKNESRNEDLLALLRLLTSKGDPSLIEDSDFEYLKDNGLNSEARNIAFSLLKGSDDFLDYLRYRKLFSTKEFFAIRYQTSMIISYKSYLNSVLLIDGKELYLELYNSFSYSQLNPQDVYLARDLIKDKKDIHILAEVAHKYVKNELGKRNRNKDYFFYLLYLDYLQDDSLAYYLFTKEVLLDKESKKTKGIWLYLLERNDLLKRVNMFSYGKGKECL